MNFTIKPVFSFSIDIKLSDRGVTIGKYDGIHSSLTAVTQGNKIIIHSPQRRYNLFNSQKNWSEIKSDIGALSVNHKVTAIATGKLSESDKDYLAIGTEANLLVYQVDDNLEIFFKEITEGVRCLQIGSVESTAYLFVGTLTTVTALNEKGDEIFWIVSSADHPINTIILYDFSRDNEKEIILGSEDKIRIYKKDKFVNELSENAPIKQILPMGTLLAFILDNGTIGIYEQYMRLWRIKSKVPAMAIASYDLLGTNSVQLITGWENGKIDIRDPKSGDVLMKLSAPNKIIGMLVTDYRGSGRPDLMCITEQGDILGYTSSTTNLAPLTTLESSQIKELLSLKQNLLLEMSHYENNAKVNEAIIENEDTYVNNNQLKVADNVAVIPANTRLQIAISTSADKKSSVEISISTNNSTIIKAVIIFADGIFPNGETLIVHPPAKPLSSYGYGAAARTSGTSKIVVPLKLPKDEAYDIHIKAFVGYAEGSQFHVFELNRQLPKFSMYALPEKITGSPKSLSYVSKLSSPQFSITTMGFVRFKINERLQRICLWINQSFLLPADIDVQNSETDSFDFFKIPLVCIRDNTPLELTFYNDNTIQITTDDIELAGNLIQSMSQFLNVTNLNSSAYFPTVVSKMREFFDKLNGLQESYKILKTDTSLKVNLAKKYVIRAEDARVSNTDKVGNYYNELMLANEDLISGFKIRTQNFDEIQKHLAAINDLLYKATRLRVGSFASQMMASYKAALEQKDIEKLIQIMEISG